LRTSSLLQLPLSPPPPSLRSSPPAPTLGGGGRRPREQLQEQQPSQQAWRRQRRRRVAAAAPQRWAAAPAWCQGSYTAGWSLAIGLQPMDWHHPHVAQRTSSTGADSPASSSATGLHHPAAATCSCTDCGGRPVGSTWVLPSHGRPALLGHLVAGLCV
jgi:hypothetical protein